MSRPESRWARAALVFVVVAWLASVVVGFSLLLAYQETPGVAGVAPTSWPSASTLVSPRSMTAFLFVHPRCSCSMATVAEFERLQPGCPGPRTVVVCFNPSDRTPAWCETALLRRARGLHRAQVVLDVDGVEARRFGVTTSGTLLLFDGTGQLRFAGGLTRARAHEGRSDGTDAVAAVLAGRQPQLARAPVFGCPLSAVATRRHLEDPGHPANPCCSQEAQ